jgi:hypothetical protein
MKPCSKQREEEFPLSGSSCSGLSGSGFEPDPTPILEPELNPVFSFRLRIFGSGFWQVVAFLPIHPFLQVLELYSHHLFFFATFECVQ